MNIFNLFIVGFVIIVVIFFINTINMVGNTAESWQRRRAPGIYLLNIFRPVQNTNPSTEPLFSPPVNSATPSGIPAKPTNLPAGNTEQDKYWVK